MTPNKVIGNVEGCGELCVIVMKMHPNASEKYHGMHAGYRQLLRSAERDAYLRSLAKWAHMGQVTGDVYCWGLRPLERWGDLMNSCF